MLFDFINSVPYVLTVIHQGRGEVYVKGMAGILLLDWSHHLKPSQVPFPLHWTLVCSGDWIELPGWQEEKCGDASHKLCDRGLRPVSAVFWLWENYFPFCAVGPLSRRRLSHKLSHVQGWSFISHIELTPHRGDARGGLSKVPDIQQSLINVLLVLATPLLCCSSQRIA